MAAEKIMRVSSAVAHLFRAVRRLCFGLAMILPVGAAADHLATGQSVAEKLSLGAKQIPLPVGEWRVAGYGSSAPGEGVFGAFDAIQNLIAFRLQDGAVDMLAEVSVNALPVVDGWGLSRDCLRSDIYLTVTQYKSGFDGSCYFVKRTAPIASDDSHRAWGAAKIYATEQGLRLPPGWVTVGFRLFDRQDVVDVRYHFNPETRGLEAAGLRESEAWKVDRVEKDAPKRKFVEDLSLWGAHTAAYVEAGLRNRVADLPALAMPGHGIEAQPRPAVVGRLETLGRFHAEAAIDDAQFGAQHSAIANEQSAATEGGWLSQSIKKNISFRVFGSAVDWILAFTVTLSGPISTGITASIVAIHSVIFVFNDRYWDTYWARNGRRDGTQLIDFVYLGGEA